MEKQIKQSFEYCYRKQQENNESPVRRNLRDCSFHIFCDVREYRWYFEKRNICFVGHDAQVYRVQHCHGKNARKRSEEHTSELQSPDHLVCRLLLEKKK